MPFRDELQAAKRRIKALEDEAEALREKAERAEAYERKAKALEEELADLRERQKSDRERRRKKKRELDAQGAREPETQDSPRIWLLKAILLALFIGLLYLIANR